MDLLIGVIWATSELRAIAVDERGILHAAARRPVPPRYPHRGWAEVDARLAAAALVEALAELVRAGVDPKAVRGIGVGAMGDAALGVDGRGVPVAPAMLWLDRRGAFEGRDARERPGRGANMERETGAKREMDARRASHVERAAWTERARGGRLGAEAEFPGKTHAESLPDPDGLTVSDIWEYARSSSDEHVYENTELDGRLNVRQPAPYQSPFGDPRGFSPRRSSGPLTAPGAHSALRMPDPAMSSGKTRLFDDGFGGGVEASEAPHAARAPYDASFIDNRMREKMEALQRSGHPPALWLQPAGYLTGFLTGEWTLDLTSAHAFPGFSPADLAFREPLDRLPDLRVSYDIAGGLLPDVAAATGLVPGTPVTCGAHELALGMLGCASTPGHVLEASGQTGSIAILCDAPLTAPPMALGCHVTPNQYVLHTGTTAGSVLNWLGDQVNDSMTRLIREAAGLPAGSGGLLFLPHLAGLRAPWDQSVRASLFGLTYDKSPAYMTRAVLEGVAFAIQDILLGAVGHSVPLTRLSICGGSARVDLWSQMKADVTGRPTCIPEIDDAACLGAAMLAAVGVRRYASFEEAMANMARCRKQFMPGSEHRIYRRYFELYQTLSRQLQPAYEQLARIQGV